VINTADHPSGRPSLVGELYSAYFDFTLSTSTSSVVRTEAHGCPTLTRYTRTLSHHARTHTYTCMPTCTWVPGIEQRTRSSTSPGRPCSPSFWDPCGPGVFCLTCIIHWSWDGDPRASNLNFLMRACPSHAAATLERGPFIPIPCICEFREGTMYAHPMHLRA
jgi:hypothetical protein